MTEPLLQVQQVSKEFLRKKSLNPHKRLSLKAVREVSFTLNSGETLGIVGESGCGKSTLGRLVMRLLEPNAGKIIFEGRDLGQLRGEELRRARSGFQMVFQDPYASFDPRMTINEIMREPLKYHNLPPGEWQRRIEEMLHTVSMPPEALHRYPHEFSGGQRQRISIARALLLQPKLVVADEPVAALDVSIQTQILNLLCDLKEKYRLAMIFISHNLATVEYVSDRIAVMYLGKIVELAEAHTLYSRPLHPYTQLLISAIPAQNPLQRGQGKRIRGELPDQLNPPLGCPFCTRCPQTEEGCGSTPQQLREVSPGHFVACQLAHGEEVSRHEA